MSKDLFVFVGGGGFFLKSKLLRIYKNWTKPVILVKQKEMHPIKKNECTSSFVFNKHGMKEREN